MSDLSAVSGAFSESFRLPSRIRVAMQFTLAMKMLNTHYTVNGEYNEEVNETKLRNTEDLVYHKCIDTIGDYVSGRLVLPDSIHISHEVSEHTSSRPEDEEVEGLTGEQLVIALEQMEEAVNQHNAKVAEEARLALETPSEPETTKSDQPSNP